MSSPNDNSPISAESAESKKFPKKACVALLLAVALIIGGYFLWRSIASLGEMRVAAAGGAHTVVIADDGSLWAWGRNNWGELGDGTTRARTRPVQISADTDWVSVAVGHAHNIAIRADGSLWGWGWNHKGQLGDGTTSNRTRPIQIGSDTDWARVAAGENSTFAIKEDGSLWAWGANYWGPLGDGTYGWCLGGGLARPHYRSPDASPYLTTPMQFGADTDWADVAVARWHAVAIRTDGTLWAWGENSAGWTLPLGRSVGTWVASNTPVQIGTDADWASVSASQAITLVIKTDGSLWAFGGQLPPDHSVETDISAPRQIGTDTEWAVAVAGHYHHAAIAVDGSLWTWGRTNHAGRLGDGSSHDTSGRNVPAQVGTAASWTSAAVSNSHTVAIRDDGSLWSAGLTELIGRGFVFSDFNRLQRVPARLLWHRADDSSAAYYRAD